MERPPGMLGFGPDDILALNICIYGLVKAAMQYHKKMAKIFKIIGYTGGDVDQYISFVGKMTREHTIALYMDGNLFVNFNAAVNSAICHLQEHGMIQKTEDDLYDYLSCEFVFSEDMRKTWLVQSHLMSNLEKSFRGQVKGLRKYTTIGTASLNQIHQEDKALCLPAEKHMMY